jgi:hypothetical protein
MNASFQTAQGNTACQTLAKELTNEVADPVVSAPPRATSKRRIMANRNRQKAVPP